MDTISVFSGAQCPDVSTREPSGIGLEGTIRKNLLGEFATPLRDLQHAQEHMKVYLRIRPFTPIEIEKKENQDCMEILNDTTLQAHAPPESNTHKNSLHGCGKQMHKFTFSSIFSENTTQAGFFEHTMQETVKNFIEGQNCLIFTYGVTNSGKTYTIQGEQHDAGILPRALDVVFNSIQGRQVDGYIAKPDKFCDAVKLSAKAAEHEAKVKEEILKRAQEEESDIESILGSTRQSEMSTGSEESIMIDQSVQEPSKEEFSRLFEQAHERIRDTSRVDVETQGDVKYSVWVSYAELYNENIYDLLESVPKKKNARRPTLIMRQDSQNNFYIKGLKEICVTSADEAYKVLTIGKENLHIACTKLNQVSSRSHCIFTIKILRVIDKPSPRFVRISMLSFCDLAGAERYGKTMAEGDRIKEAGNINTSLLSLGRCIKILRHNQQHQNQSRLQQIVPFRDSKLTRLFQSFFSGHGIACMIVNINQCASMFDETLHALKYSAIAKQVVVTQVKKEEVKEKPKHKRLVSMAFSPSQAGKKPARHTIEWESPSTRAHLSALERKAKAVPIPEDEDEELDSTLEEDAFDDKEREYEQLIAELRVELFKQKKQNILMEKQIREEVCNEMQQQIIEMEEQHSEAMAEVLEAANTRADKKIEMFLQASARKKRKCNFDDHSSSAESTEVQINKSLYDNKVDELKDMGHELSTTKDQISVLQEHSGNLTKEKDKLWSENSQFQFTIADLKSQIHKLEDKNEEKSAHIQELEEELRDMSDKVACLQAAQMDTDRDSLQTAQLHNSKAAENDRKIEEATERIKQLEQNIKDLTQRESHARLFTEQVKEDLGVAEDLASSLKKQLIAMTEEKQSLEHSVQSSHQEIELIKAKCEKSEIEAEKAQALVVKLRVENSKYEEELQELKDKCARQQQAAKINSTQDSDLRNQLCAAAETNRKQNAQLDELTNKLADAQTASDEKEASEKHLQQQCEELQKQLTTTERDLDAEKESHNKMLKTLRLEVQQHESRVSLLRADLESKDAHIQTMTEKLCKVMEETDSHRSIVESKNVQVRNLTENLSTLKEETNSYKSALQSKDAEVQAMTEQLSKLKDENDSNKLALDKKEAEIQTMTQKLCKLTEDANSSQATVDSKTVQIQVMTEKLDKLKDENCCTQSTLENKLAELQAMSKKLDKITKKADSHQATLENKEAKILTLTEKVCKLKEESESHQATLDQVKQECKEKELTITNMKQVLQEQDTTMEKQEQVLAERVEHVEKLTADLQSHETKLSIVRKELAQSRSQLEQTNETTQQEITTLKAQLIDRENQLSAVESKQNDVDKSIHKQMAEIQQQKAQCEDELQLLRDQSEKWRKERDELVNKLSNILKEKDNEIQALRQATSTDITELKAELEDKDGTIAQLSAHLDQTKQKVTRSATRHRESTESTSSEQDDSEVSKLQAQIAQLKSTHRIEIQRITKAKDEIITELKDQHSLLQKAFNETASTRSATTVSNLQDELNDSDVFQTPRGRTTSSISSTSSTVKKYAKRSRKRSTGGDENKTEVKTAKRTSKRTRKPVRDSVLQNSMRENVLVEEEAPVAASKPAAAAVSSHADVIMGHHNDIIDLDDVTSNENKQTAFTSKPKGGRRTRKLRSKNAETLLLASPYEIENQPKESAQNIVMRQLRSRKK